MACLVQQLFRQKIGQELDQGIVDEVLFPMLRPRKHPSKELLQDIKLATDTLIITDYARREAHSVPTFTPVPGYWTYSSPWHVGGSPHRGELQKPEDYPLDKKLKGKSPFWVTVGKRTSKVRRRKIRNDDWGTIDILNELRGLNYPQIGYKPRPYVIEEPDSFDDAFISLSEDNSLPVLLARSDVDHSRENSVQRILIARRSQFVNNFLDDVLITDKRLTWSSTACGRRSLGVF